MSKSLVYLDTSAYLAILLGEDGGKPLKKSLSDKALCASTILFLEAERTLVRLCREKIITETVFAEAIRQMNQDIELFQLRDFTLDLCMTGIFPAVSIPRSMDLIHLRTAGWFRDNGGVQAFCTLDQKLRASAKELGFEEA